MRRNLVDENSEDDEAWDSPEDYQDTSGGGGGGGGGISSKSSLGIDIGSQLNPLTESQAADIKEEATDTINSAFDDRIQEIERMKVDMRRDFDKSREAMKFASELRAKEATSNLLNKIDKMSDEFLESNSELRSSTKMAARADASMNGQGLEIGSWGNVGGMDVLTASGGGSMGSGLLGSIGAANLNKVKSDLDQEMDGVVTDTASEKRILLVCDEGQDKNIQKVLDEFQTLLSSTFPDPIQIDTYKPTSVIPMGGNNAQCVIIAASSLSNGRESAQKILSRLLQRSIAPGGGGVANPPSHFIVLSSVGTTRIDKFPYSMQNMMGGKLTKAREVEEVVMSTVKGRLVSDSNVSPSLDFTILNLGEIVQDDKIVGKKDGEMIVSPGDSLDGKVGVNAAANVLLQAVALRPNARNTTLSVVGGMEKEIGENVWEDWFLRLEGPELWRSELISSNNNGGDVDVIFNELANYIDEWSAQFENGAKGTGLTTPVSVVKSKVSPNAEGSIIRTYNLRLEFKTTNTGSNYRSATEERDQEQQNSSGKTLNKKGPPGLKTPKQKKEGGVQINVELISPSEGEKHVRVRAKRCNMSDTTAVKEISETTILKNLGKAVEVWRKK